MNHPASVSQFRQIVARLNPQSRLLRAWSLAGGVSAQVTALEIEQPDGTTRRLIVRQHGDADLRENPNIAADEFRLLQLLQTRGIAAPMPYTFDQSGEIFPTPYIVVEYIDGHTDFAPSNLDDFLSQLARQLSQIHTVDGETNDLSFLPDQRKRYTEKLRHRPAVLDESLQEGQIRDALEQVWSRPQTNPSVLLHGDFWPGNILWKAEQLVSVIDWEDAASGDPLADVANARMEMLWAFGVDAMHTFTRHYQSMSAIDFTKLPVWELCAALRPAHRIGEWAGDAASETRMRERHRMFVAQAFEQLGIG